MKLFNNNMWDFLNNWKWGIFLDRLKYVGRIAQRVSFSVHFERLYECHPPDLLYNLRKERPIQEAGQYLLETRETLKYKSSVEYILFNFIVRYARFSCEKYRTKSEISMWRPFWLRAIRIEEKGCYFYSTFCWISILI